MTLPATAQVVFGPGISLAASGNVSAGYAGGYGSDSSSERNINFGGSGSANGFYYAPSLLSYIVSPYYNQSRANSNYQSIGDSSGVTSSLTAFSGSHYPGGFTFFKEYDSTGTYGLVGTPNFTTHGNGQGFSIGWSAALPRWPSLSVGYADSSGSSSVYGSSAESQSTSHNLNLRSSYSTLGFKLNAFYMQSSTHGSIPAFLSGVTDDSLDTESRNTGISTEHGLPLNGTFSASYGYASSSAEDHGSISGNNSTDTVTASAGFHPTQRLTLNVGTTYTDNLQGALNQEIIAAGGSAVNTELGSTSSSLSLNGAAGYAITQHLGVQAVMTRQEQYFDGSSYNATFISGSLYYNKRLFDMFTFSVTGLDTEADGGSNAIGMQGNVNFYRIIKDWDTNASFSYGQNVQTLLVTYTTSYMNYSANVRRRLSKYLTFNAGFAGGHSGISQESGTSSHSESYFSSLGYRGYNIGGGYSSSSGVSVLTANGLSSTTSLPPVISPLEQILYNGTSYNISASATPLSRLTIAASYANSHNSTIGTSVSSLNQTTSVNSQLQYRVRRMGFMAGYSRFFQSISGGGTPAAAVSSYYVGINRWINFF
jgi:hypothetical protein